MLRGCWLLPPSWLLASLDEGRFLPEAPHMLHDAFPGAALRPQPPPAAAANSGGGDDHNDALGGGAVAAPPPPPPPLRGVAVFVNERDEEQRETFAALLRAVGARIAPTARGAAVSVGTAPPAAGRRAATARAAPVAVKPDWLFDSIMAGAKLGLDEYRHAPLGA